MCIPFVQDSEGRLLSIYSKFDVINLAAEKTYDDLEVLKWLIKMKKTNLKIVKKYEVVSNLMIVWEYHCSAKSEGMLNVKLCAFLI